MLECAPAINNARARASFARFREIIRSLLRFPFVTARRPLKNPRARQSAIANRAAERICSDVLHAQRTALALFPRKIILSLPLSLSLSLSLSFPLLRCSLQSLGEYLKRPDQSASGQFHQHLNTRLLFLREPLYLSSLSPSLSSLSFSAFPDLPKQPPALWISLRVDGRPAKRAEKSETLEPGLERVGKFSKVLAETRNVKGTRADR